MRRTSAVPRSGRPRSAVKRSGRGRPTVSTLTLSRLERPVARKLLLGTAVVVVAAGLVLLRRHRPPTPPSPYVAQLESPVRGLSAQEVRDLLAGAGAGYARTAELNGYPGPRHVLEMRDHLELTPDQLRRTEAVFAAMQQEAQRLGAAIVERERALAAGFAGRVARERDVAAAVDSLARLYGRLRTTHLAAHVATTGLLTDAQIARYKALRGYGGAEGEHPH